MVNVIGDNTQAHPLNPIPSIYNYFEPNSLILR